MLTTLLAPALLGISLPGCPTPTPDELFPLPATALVIEAAERGQGTQSLMDVLDLYAASTGQGGLWQPDTETLLKNTRVPAGPGRRIEAGNVQQVVESLLRSAGFAISPASVEGAPMFRVQSMSGMERTTLRENAIYLESPNARDTAARHPAVLFTTVVEMPSTDVRMLSNTLRTMVTDGNTQQILPAGTSGSMVLVGFGDVLADRIALLEAIDESNRRVHERHKVDIEAVKLEHRDADEVAELLLKIYGKLMAARGEEPGLGQVGVVPDASSGTLLVRGTTEQRATVRKLAAAIDVPDRR